MPIALPHAAAHPVGAWPNHPPFTGRLPAPADPVDCALLFQVKALLVFEPSEPLQLLARAFASGSSSLYWDVSRLPSRTGRAYIVTGACAFRHSWRALWIDCRSDERLVVRHDRL